MLLLFLACLALKHEEEASPSGSRRGLRLAACCNNELCKNIEIIFKKKLHTVQKLDLACWYWLSILCATRLKSLSISWRKFALIRMTSSFMHVYLRAIMLIQVLLSFTKLCCLCSLSACCGHICKGFAGFLAERLHFESTFLHLLSNTHARTEHLVLLRVTIML